MIVCDCVCVCFCTVFPGPVGKLTVPFTEDPSLQRHTILQLSWTPTLGNDKMNLSVCVQLTIGSKLYIVDFHCKTDGQCKNVLKSGQLNVNIHWF